MALAASGTGRVSIHPDTSIGTVRLTVADIARSRAFYERAIGLRAVERDDGSLTLTTAAGHPLIELRGDPSASALDRRRAGLYHLAILVPSRHDLALAIARLVQARWPLDGASDHLVSEALYLSDPDGNGIEIYRDRPREQWRRTSDGLEMSTLPLDLDGVVQELTDADQVQQLVPAGTTIGHVHLQVADLASAEAFYSDALGFDVVVRGYPGALFVSAGGYHHHIGLNTWHSRGGPPAAQGSVGLRSFDLLLPDRGELERVLSRVGAAGIEVQPGDGGALVRDPSGNGALLRVAA